MKIDMFEMRHFSPFTNTVFLPLMGLDLCEAVLSLPQVKALMNEKWDLVFGEAFLDESIIAGFAHKSGAPIIGLGTFMPNVWVNFMVNIIFDFFNCEKIYKFINFY